MTVHPPGPTVLVVEDDPDNATLIGRWLDRAGFVVRHAISGEAALTEYARSRPDILVLDLFLPGIDGLEVLRRLRRSPGGAGLPVVVTSIVNGRSEDVDIVGEVDTWLVKPFSAQQLQGALTKALNSRAGAAVLPPEPRADEGGEVR